MKVKLSRKREQLLRLLQLFALKQMLRFIRPMNHLGHSSDISNWETVDFNVPCMLQNVKYYLLTKHRSVGGLQQDFI